jgi:hypothetical protein
MTLDEPDHTRLRTLLDDSFGAGPPLRPAADRLAVGRAALRRRRRSAAAGSAVGVVLVVVASFTAFGSGGSGPQGADPAVPGPSEVSQPEEPDQPAPPDELRTLEEVRKARLVSNQHPASLDLDGSLVVKDGWRVTRRVLEPVGHQPPEASLGVVVTDGARTRWMLLTLDRVLDEHGDPIRDEVSPSASADDPGKGHSRFEDWLASMVELAGGPGSSPLVEVTAADEVVAGPGATLLDVQQVPVVEGYTSPGDRVARVDRGGRVWFVVVRGHGPDADLVPVDGDVLPESTLDALLAHLAQQTESGEGVR